MKTLGESICLLRKEKGYTQSELASRLGISDKSVSKWERNLSAPDISLLSRLAELLGTSVDALLSGEASAQKFISLEKYLMGEYGYAVPDLHPKGETAVLLSDGPELDEAQHGYALSGKNGALANKNLFGCERPFSLAELREGKLGVIYVSNVPLISPFKNDDLSDSLIDELEYTRLNRFYVNPLLRERFVKKLGDVLNNENVKLIAMMKETVQKYIGAFITSVPRSVLEKMHDRIACGELKFVFVGPIPWWEKENRNGLRIFRDFLNS